MKKISIIFLVIALVLSLTNIVFAQADKVFHWKLQSMTTPTDIESKIVLPDFCDRIREMSNGRLDITLYNAGELTPSLEVAEALRLGMIDISYAFPTYFTGIIPEAAIEMGSMPPLIFESVKDAAMMYNYGGLDDIIRKGFADYGIVYLSTLVTSNPITFWSKKPMYAVEDLRGFKMRTYGYLSKVFSKLGATPVFLPHEEVYNAIATGTCDGSQTSSKRYLALKLNEVAPYFYETSVLLNPDDGAMMVSQKSWDALPDDLKAIVKSANAQLLLDLDYYGTSLYGDLLKRFPDLGVTLIRWSPEETQKIRDVSLTFLDEIAEKSEGNKKGIEIIKEYLREKGYLK